MLLFLTCRKIIDWAALPTATRLVTQLTSIHRIELSIGNLIWWYSWVFNTSDSIEFDRWRGMLSTFALSAIAYCESGRAEIYLGRKIVSKSKLHLGRAESTRTLGALVESLRLYFSRYTIIKRFVNSQQKEYSHSWGFSLGHCDQGVAWHNREFEASRQKSQFKCWCWPVFTLIIQKLWAKKQQSNTSKKTRSWKSSSTESPRTDGTLEHLVNRVTLRSDAARTRSTYF